MIRHIVLMKLKPEVDPALIEAAGAGLATLQAEIAGIVAYAFGTNNSTEGLTEGFGLGFTIDFVDAAARDAYLPHPAHQAYIPSVRAVSTDVLVFDFEI
jgi:hypothetical protein